MNLNNVQSTAILIYAHATWSLFSCSLTVSKLCVRFISFNGFKTVKTAHALTHLKLNSDDEQKMSREQLKKAQDRDARPP